MCRPTVEWLIKQAVCGRNDSNDGRNAAGVASVRRPCRHTAHARTYIVLKNRHHRSPCVRALRPSLLHSFAEGDTFASVSEQHIKKTFRFFTHSSDDLRACAHCARRCFFRRCLHICEQREQHIKKKERFFTHSSNSRALASDTLERQRDTFTKN